MNLLPANLYSVEASRQLDQIAIQQLNVSAYTLMTRAAEAVFEHLQQTYPLCRRILVCCGAGNNAGDGYIVAKLALKAGMKVDVVSLVDPAKLTGDVLAAFKEWKSLGYQLTPFSADCLKLSNVVIDALLGTGLQREVSAEWKQLIDTLNQSSIPVISVDVPSGLDADTGEVRGVAVQADSTVSFISLKKGLFTYQAADYCGNIIFDNLGVDAKIYRQVMADAQLLNETRIANHLKPRKFTSHKSMHGHVLVIGGNVGMAGAVRLAAESALRTGAGLVTVLTRPEHVAGIVSACPELMVLGIEDKADQAGRIPRVLLQKCSCILIGPGLGQDSWANQLLGQVLQTSTAKVVDADALNLLSSDDGPRQDWVLTPHPGEAARLLDSSIRDIQENRFTSAALLQQTYGGIAVLKGSGTLIQNDTGLSVCPYGNPGMATAGMGDVLTGVIAAFIAQGLALPVAAEMAVMVHGLAGDIAAADSPRGLKASDLFIPLRKLVNPRK